MASEILSLGEYGAPPCPETPFTDQQLSEACEACKGHLVIVSTAPVDRNGAVGQQVNWIGELKKLDSTFSIELSNRHAHLTNFYISHFPGASEVRVIPEVGRKYFKIIRFTVWAGLCRNSLITHYEAKQAELMERVAQLTQKVSELESARLTTTNAIPANTTPAMRTSSSFPCLVKPTFSTQRTGGVRFPRKKM